MKKISSLSIAGVLALVMLFSHPFTASAQTAGGKEMLKNSTPQQRADMQTKLMKEELNLTDTQYAQVSRLNLEYAEKMQPIFTSDDGKFSKMRKAKSIMGEKDSKLKGILSEEQYNKYQEYVKSKMQNLKNYKKDN